MSQRTKIYVGGQAVLEGVMMRGPRVTATAVRNPEGAIVMHTEPTRSIADRYRWLRFPILRGALALYESLVIGMKALGFSAQVSGEEGELSDRDIFYTILLSGGIAILLFVVLPTYVAKWILWYMINPSHLLLNGVEGVVRLVFFLLYIWLIGRAPDIQRVYEYHGAEHMTIRAYEADEPLKVENIQKYSRLHPRCGTNFLMIVMMVSILVFSFLGWPNLWERIVSRIVLLPVVAGLSYEVIRWAGRSDGWLIRALITPGLWLQRLTTREPSVDQIEVAIAALEAVRPADEDAYET